MRVQDDETFSEFPAKLRDTVNKSFALGIKVDDVVMTLKISRSLTERFRVKVSYLETSVNTELVSVEDLVESILTIEIILPSLK